MGGATVLKVGATGLDVGDVTGLDVGNVTGLDVGDGGVGLESESTILTLMQFQNCSGAPLPSDEIFPQLLKFPG